ncbi:cytochrome P450 family protein [Nocardiopsis suaedae]|uniref:Cytochrome P450 n=1 Tax=Nocardiopsis suaedae TaxID=3018444 RepID=A0ABT4TFS8_9ACTN|nr:cytochrome P450 [Nocardiopsis suaedae]MDA2803490.1 cytochrome P450 [Nocardiopsis suaedae]
MATGHPPLELYDPGFHADHHAAYARMRKEHGPVVPVMLEPGVEGRLVVDYALITAWCRDERTFSRDARRWRDWREGRIPDDSSLLGMMGHRPNALFSDGEEHRRVRRAMVDSLSPFEPGRVGAEARSVAERLVDGFCERGEAELMEEFARPLPLLVMNGMFGMDQESGRRFFTALRDMWDGVDAERANAELERVLSAHIDRKRDHPGDDITSTLMRHRAGLTDEEVLQHLVLMVGAGHEPSAALLSNSVRVLLTDRALGDDLAGARTGIDEAIERVMWSAPPVTNYPVMYPVRDVEVPGGSVVPEGTPVLLGFAAANRFLSEEYADRMDDAPNRAHLAWGVGAHRCPAKDIATAIAVAGIEVLVRRLPGLRLGVAPDELSWRVSPFAHALTRLPVAFTPQDPEEEGTPWTPSDSVPETSTPKRPSSERPAQSSLSNFLVRLLRGR